MPTSEIKTLKKKKLRNNEYYDIQLLFDNLYNRSKLNYNFNKIYDLIISRENILLAYRNIKSNRGGKTKGVNKTTILDMGGIDNDRIVEYVRHRLQNYQPHSIRRKYIPKKNGKLRPLGIPTIEDRLIQQCFLQILEPILEAKFHDDSYGFRPNRSTHNAVAKSCFYINNSKCYYVVDVDIKGFFDNVDHGKLLKQLWTLGIRDKKVLSIISKMLKAEIEGEGKPTKGTPQGGILSPLLANVVLNELDWWIDSQWLGFKANQITNFGRITDRPYKNTSNKLVVLRRTKLKPCFIVRYADDFKIFTTNYENAVKLFNATKDWISTRLKLEISPEKSKIVNLKTNYSEFLGFKMKAVERVKDGKTKYVTKTKMLDKEKVRIKNNIKGVIKDICDDNTPKSMYKLNSMILGVHNYYKVATLVSEDFGQIEHNMYSYIRFKFRRLAKSKGTFSDTYEKFYGKYKRRKQFFIHGIAMYPISGVTFSKPIIFNSRICNYTRVGRGMIHQKLEFVNKYLLAHVMNNPVPNRTVEYNDNRISLFSAQKGRCAITGLDLKLSNMHCHHKNPKSKGGTDEYKNLIFLIDDIHLLIHSNKSTTQKRILNQFNIDKKMLEKINELRKLVGNYNITDYKLVA
jgi:group II intron reverse transcriptase/maturase